MNNNNKRCCVCDYCCVSDPSSPKRTFSSAHGSEWDYVCNQCVASVEDALSEFQGEDEDTMPLEDLTLAVHGDPEGGPHNEKSETT